MGHLLYNSGILSGLPKWVTVPLQSAHSSRLAHRYSSIPKPSEAHTQWAWNWTENVEQLLPRGVGWCHPEKNNEVNVSCTLGEIFQVLCCLNYLEFVLFLPKVSLHDPHNIKAEQKSYREWSPFKRGPAAADTFQKAPWKWRELLINNNKIVKAVKVHSILFLV